jgi:hypothetical protein
MTTEPAKRFGGTRLVGRRYYLGARPVVVVVGWGAGAAVRNVKIRFLDDETETVRPFRGLTIAPR